MKKITFLFLCLFLYFSQATAEEQKEDLTKIFTSMEESRDLIPDTLLLPLSVTVKAPEEIEVIDILGKIDRKIRSLGFEYKGGQYSIDKNCWWERDRQKCSGYIGTISYGFELKEASEQNEIIKAIEEIKKGYGEKMNYEINSPQWIVSEKEVKRVKKELQIQLISSAQNFAKEAGNLLGKTCFVSEVSFETGFYRPFYPIFYKSAVKENVPAEVPEPKKEEKSVKVDARITITCR